MRFGEVERAICALEDGLCAVGFPGTGDADAQGEEEFFVADVVRLFDLGFDALADAARDGGCGVGQHDEEFIALRENVRENGVDFGEV